MFWLSEYFVAFGRVVATKLEGASKAIHENVAALDGDSSKGEPQFGPLGYYGRPMPPVERPSATGLRPEGWAEFIGFRLGDNIHQIGAYRDLRLSAQVNPAEGSIGIAHYGGGFIEQSWNDSGDGTTITLYALRKTSSGAADKASAITIDSSGSGPAITIVHESGQRISMTDDGATILSSADGSAYIELSNGKLTINAAEIIMNGGVILGTNNPALAMPIMLGTMAPALMVKGL